MKRLRLRAGISATLCATAFVHAQTIEPGSTGASLYEGMDTYHRAITTDSDEAQRWFDQGLALLFGFNHDEAIRSFKEAAARDPEAPMPWWGVSYANGMNINDREMTPERWKAGHEAAQNALARIDNATPVERALAEAVATRYTWPEPPEQRPYDEAFSKAMSTVWERFPDDPLIGCAYAESLMNLQPWDYWTVDGEAKQNTAIFVEIIEQILAQDPDHPLACHLYIHAMEAGPTPEKAVPYADRLIDEIPGSGHLVHMPSHIYARVGRYGDAVKANLLAVEADRKYFAIAPAPGIYAMYYGHNLHFLAFAAMMEGNYEVAMLAARDLERDMPDEAIRDFGWLIEGIMPTTYHVMIRFGKWQDVLKEQAPATDRLVTTAVHFYARGIAYSALGEPELARQEIVKFDAAVAKVPDDWLLFNNEIHKVLPIARAMLKGELAFREGRLEDAWDALRAGIEAEDQLIYDEPPGWMIPVRHAMGALLMSAGEYAQAEQLYREDQIIHPGNGWSLLGLQQALEAQGQTLEAKTLTAGIDFAWQRIAKSDRPTSSCLCEPGAPQQE